MNFRPIGMSIASPNVLVVTVAANEHAPAEPGQFAWPQASFYFFGAAVLLSAGVVTLCSARRVGLVFSSTCQIFFSLGGSAIAEALHYLS
jgi:hypothetical protein